ncbi:MAG: hypothetical protein ACFFCP_09690 [Promethearchaeota archaeon]
MSVLIKDKDDKRMIGMARQTTHFLACIFLLGALLISSMGVVYASSDYVLSQDVTAPNIYAWGVEGDPLLGQGFDVWANVTDDGLGVRNVSVQVTGPNMTLNDLLTFNGTFYTGSVPAFPNDGHFIVNIRTFDIANNTRTSYPLHFDYVADLVIPPDPTVTMPYVVLSSLGLIGVLIISAIIYDRRSSPSERSMQPKYDEG